MRARGQIDHTIVMGAMNRGFSDNRADQTVNAFVSQRIVSLAPRHVTFDEISLAAFQRELRELLELHREIRPLSAAQRARAIARARATVAASARGKDEEQPISTEPAVTRENP
jgi:hypothetical protein